MTSNDLTFLRLLAYLTLRCGILDKAEALYAALRALDADDCEAAKGLAWVRIEAGQAQGALNVLDEIVGPGEPSAVVQLLRARALARLGRAADAAVAMRAFLDLRAEERKATTP